MMLKRGYKRSDCFQAASSSSIAPRCISGKQELRIVEDSALGL